MYHTDVKYSFILYYILYSIFDILHVTAGETVPSCSSIGIEDVDRTECVWRVASPCSKSACGVGKQTNGFSCEGGSVVCLLDCCCKRCSGK